MLISSNGTQVMTKADRLKTLSKPGIGPAPPGLVHADMFDFPSTHPETIVMIATAQGYSGKPGPYLAHLGQSRRHVEDGIQLSDDHSIGASRHPEIRLRPVALIDGLCRPVIRDNWRGK